MMNISAIDTNVSTLRRALLLFAETVLRPIVRILLRYGLSYPEFNQVARRLYVETAMNEAEFRAPRRRRQYKARVACLTGLSRKEVLRLVSNSLTRDYVMPGSANRAARVLEAWWTDERYADANGRPLRLPFRANGERRSFSTLVAEYSGDIPPRAVLDELCRAGVCDADANDDVTALRRDYVMREFDVDTMTEAAMRAAVALARIDAALAIPESNPETAALTPVTKLAS